MSIIGLETVVYCVDDVALCTRYFEDFGLTVQSRKEGETRFLLPDQSKVVLQSFADAPVPGSRVVGPGVHEIIWGVDTDAAVDQLVAGLALDREVRRDEDGTAHFVCDDGIAMGLRVWRDKRPIRTVAEPINSPGNINRMNFHRRAIERAQPRYMQHVVFATPDVDASFSFMRDRLNFRMSDHMRAFGIFARADGTYDHHNIYFLNANLPALGFGGELRFHHTNFGVTDIDEIMAGKNHMERCGWAPSAMGVGRHRVASSLFLYLPAPTGGEAEYGADSDAIDDSWVPRSWNPMFGLAHWIHEMPEFWREGAHGADGDVSFVEGQPSAIGDMRANTVEG